MAIDKMDWQFESALEDWLTEVEAEKGISNYMWLFIICLIDIDNNILNKEIYSEEDLKNILKYTKDNILNIEELFWNFFDYQIPETAFVKSKIKDIEKYYENWYMDDFEIVFNLTSSEKLPFSIQIINRKKYLELKKKIMKNFYNMWFFNILLKK